MKSEDKINHTSQLNDDSYLLIFIYYIINCTLLFLFFVYLFILTPPPPPHTHTHRHRDSRIERSRRIREGIVPLYFDNDLQHQIDLLPGVANTLHDQIRRDVAFLAGVCVYVCVCVCLCVYLLCVLFAPTLNIHVFVTFHTPNYYVFVIFVFSSQRWRLWITPS